MIQESSGRQKGLGSCVLRWSLPKLGSGTVHPAQQERKQWYGYRSVDLIEGCGSSFLVASIFSVIKETRSSVEHEQGKESVQVGGEQSEYKTFIWESGSRKMEWHLSTEVINTGSDTQTVMHQRESPGERVSKAQGACLKNRKRKGRCPKQSVPSGGCVSRNRA